ncbi:hypothetical protein FRB97_007600 [Tulasnella sp. 331]|nr:hypothetical protein FRB97_007600 [Tulasnella sp. 331]
MARRAYGTHRGCQASHSNSNQSPVNLILPTTPQTRPIRLIPLFPSNPPLPAANSPYTTAGTPFNAYRSLDVSPLSASPSPPARTRGSESPLLFPPERKHDQDASSEDEYLYESSPSSPPLATMPKEKKDRAPRDPTEKRIPRPMNMFLFYRGEQIRLAAERGLKGEELREFTNHTINATWHSMNKDARRKYELMAEEAKEEHARKYPDYKYQPRTAKDKEVEKEYKQKLKRKEQEERQTGKRVPKGKKRAQSVDSDIQEIKKEEVSSPKENKTFSARRKTSTDKYQYYSASAFGTGGPPPDWNRGAPGPSSSSNEASASSYHRGKSSQVVYSPNQPMYANAPMMSLPYPFNQPPAPGSVFPSQLSAPQHPSTIPALTDSALEALNAGARSGYDYGAIYGGSPPILDADGGDSPEDDNDGATPESGQFSEPVYPNLWNGFGSGVNTKLAAPSENFNDYVRFPEGSTDGGAADAPSPPPLVASVDYSNWKASSLEKDVDGGSVSVEVKIPENVANGGGETSQALADQMINQMSMVAPTMQQQEDQNQQNQQLFNVNINPGTGHVEFLQNVAFDPTVVLSAFLPMPTQGSGGAYGEDGNAVAGGSGANRQLPYIHTGVPQIYKPQEHEDFSAWNQALGDGFDGGMGFMASDIMSPESAMAGGEGEFDLKVDPATAQAFFDMITQSGTGPTPAPGSEQEQSRLMYQEIKQHNPEWLMQMGNRGPDCEGGDNEDDVIAAVEDMGRNFGGAMSFNHRPSDFAGDDLSSAVVYHCSPPPHSKPLSPHDDENGTSFSAPYVPPSGASNFSGRRVGGDWKQKRPRMGRISSIQSTYSDQDSPTSPTGQSPMSGPTYAPASAISTYQYPPSSSATAWYQSQQQQQQQQPQSGMMMNLNTSMALAANGGGSGLSPTSYMTSYPTVISVPQSMRQVSANVGPPPPVKMESRPSRSILSGAGPTYGSR